MKRVNICGNCSGKGGETFSECETCIKHSSTTVYKAPRCLTGILGEYPNGLEVVRLTHVTYIVGHSRELIYPPCSQ